MFQIWPNWGPWGPWDPSPRALTLVKTILYSKLFHLGSFATNFGEKIIKKPNFQKLAKIGPQGPTLGPPPRGPWGLKMPGNVPRDHQTWLGPV